MGLAKLWLTHGPGSPGSIARAMANAYVRIRIMHPEASAQELLATTLMTRYGERLGPDEFAMVVQAVQAGESLSELTIQVWHRENPMATRAQMDPRGQAAYLQSVQIIKKENARIAGSEA